VKLRIRPLTPEFWPALEDLFGKNGASNGCWCMYWRLGNAYRDRACEQNKAALRRVVKLGPPPGLLAFDGDVAVGWCQLTPRRALPWLDGSRNREDTAGIWALSCFYVRKGYRKRGVASALIAAAMKAAKRGKARTLEAYPVDNRLPKHSSNLFTGTATTFARAGFITVGRRAPYRLVMRHDLKPLHRSPRGLAPAVVA
jgi:GNAT superfamily N-acetyltransferase